MIIDDENDVLQVYKEFRERKGFEVEVSATTANESGRFHEYYRPDFTMLDYRFPGSMNGLKAAEKIFRFDPLARILMVTASEKLTRNFGAVHFFLTTFL